MSHTDDADEALEGQTSLFLCYYTTYMKQFSKKQQVVIIVSILASFVAFLDGFVVNVALPAIAHEFGGGLTTQQWVTNAYLLTLASLILIAGSFSDIFGRVRILYAGLIAFGISSVLCAVAPDGLFLIIARALQGAAGALLVPSSLAIIMSTFSGSVQAKAIGIWTSWSVIAAIVGPLLGGLLVDLGSWRLIFAINIIPILVTLWLMRQLRNTRNESAGKVDIPAALLCVVGLGGVTYALIEQPNLGWDHPMIYMPFIAGLVALGLFVWREKQTTAPMLPLNLFKNHNFSGGNVATLFIYGALAVGTFILTIFLQQVGDYTALYAGLSLLPSTFIMFFLSSRFGSLAGKYGPRVFMSIGPMIMALGFLIMLPINATVNYWTDLLPGIVLFGVGLSATVAPLTSAILGSIDPKKSGIGSAVNNAVARIAGLIAIATLGLVVGTAIDENGFHRGLIYTAILLIIGGVVSALTIRNPATLPDQAEQPR